MPEEFIWGPGGWPKTPHGGGVFATTTPQVFYWAYIYERSTEFKCSLGAWGIGSSCYFFNHEDSRHVQFGIAELLGVLPKSRLQFLLLFFAIEKILRFFIMILVWQNSTLRFADTKLRFLDTKLRFPDTELRFPDTELRFADTKLRFSDTKLRFADTKLRFLDTKLRLPDTKLRYL